MIHSIIYAMVVSDSVVDIEESIEMDVAVVGKAIYGVKIFVFGVN